MVCKMLLGIVRDRATGDTFDIGVSNEILERARQELAKVPYLELVLDEETNDSRLQKPRPKTTLPFADL